MTRSYHNLVITFPALAVVATLVGCTSYSEVSEVAPKYQPNGPGSGTIATVRREMAAAMKSSRSQPMAALGGFITAAEAASQQLQRSPADLDARQEYNFAVARILSTVKEANLDPWTQPLTVPTSGGGYVLTRQPNPNPLWFPGLYDFTPADQFDVRGSYVSERTIRAGLGAPMVAVGKQINEKSHENFGLPRVYYGVTAVVRFEGRRCLVDFKDPLADETVTMHGRTYPMAADFTVPLAVGLAANDPKKMELLRVFRPASDEDTARIARLQPYDPNKRVLLVIHGLMDSQATWTPMINTLRGDPEFRKNYQVWFYSYPSGYPYQYSAMILRRELDAIRKKFPLTKPMVVMGHSMGGCISRLLITDTDERLWKDLFGTTPAETKFSPETKQLFMEGLIFRHRPEVGRVIFIAAPLRGSEMANHWYGRLASKLVKSPTTLLKAGADALRVISLKPGDLQLKGMPNSIDTLSPTNRFVKAINKVPVTPGIPYHTIMGNRGNGGPPDCSDGIVPYWSSHLDGAQSEKLVPSGHSAHQNPEAIKEVQRILKLNLKESLK